MTTLSAGLRVRPNTWQHLFATLAVLAICMSASYAISARAVYAYAVDASWVSQTSDEGGFSIRMPGMAMQNTSLASALGGRGPSFYELNKPGINFGVGYTNYPDAYLLNLTPDQQLDRWYDNAVSALNGKLLSAHAVSLGSYPGKQLAIQLPNNTGVIHGRVFLVDYRLYLVMAITSSTRPSLEVTRYLDSFKLED